MLVAASRVFSMMVAGNHCVLSCDCTFRFFLWQACLNQEFAHNKPTAYIMSQALIGLCRLMPKNMTDSCNEVAWPVIVSSEVFTLINQLP